MTPSSAGDAVLARDLGTIGDRAALHDAVDAGMIASPSVAGSRSQDRA